MRLSLCDDGGPGLALAPSPCIRDWKVFGTLPPDMFTCFVNMGLLPLPAVGLVTATLGTTFGMACKWA